MDEKLNHKSDLPDDEVLQKPIRDRIIDEIENLVDSFVPPFIERYSEKLKNIINDEPSIQTRETIHSETIRGLGIERIEDPLSRFILHSIKPKLESIISPQEKEQAFELANKIISEQIEQASNKIRIQIQQLLDKEFGDAIGEEQEKKEEDEFIAEVIGKYVQIVEENPEEILKESSDDIEEYPEIVPGTIDLSEPETKEPKIADFNKIKDQLIENILKKYVHKIEEKFSNYQDQVKAKELFKQRIELIVEDILAQRRHKSSN